MTDLDATMQDAVEARSRSFFVRNVWVLLLAAVLIVAVVVTTLTWIGQRGMLDGQDERISELRGEVRTAQTLASEQVSEDLLTSLGVNRGRITQDRRVIDNVVSTAFTWDGGAAYDRARVELQERYGLSDDDAFLTEFMPPATYNEDADGKRYYYIDAQGLNSNVGDESDVQVLKVAAGDYSYAVLVDVAITSDSIEVGGTQPEKVTNHRTVLLYLTVDAEGNVSGLTGVVPSGTTRHSK